jgi:hypothetical protein
MGFSSGFFLQQLFLEHLGVRAKYRRKQAAMHPTERQRPAAF